MVEKKEKELHYFHGVFKCAAPNCKNVITHFVGEKETDQVWCREHASMARRWK